MVKKIIHILLRKKTRFFLTPVLIVAIFFVLYQLIIFTQLTSPINVEVTTVSLLRGTHSKQTLFYKPNDKNQFTCIHSMEKINFSQVNDDFCDCLDGSDEPGTNACLNGIFFCKTQGSYKNFHKTVPSTKVNDGVCDCCDGSDEWKQVKFPLELDQNQQRKLNRYITPCLNLCNN